MSATRTFETPGVVTARDHQDWKLRHWALTETLKNWRAREIAILHRLRDAIADPATPHLPTDILARQAKDAGDQVTFLSGELDDLCGGRR